MKDEVIKMCKRLLLGVDELTLVLSTTAEIESPKEWDEIAQNIVNEFTKRANLENIFGVKRESDDTLPQGYTVGYKYGDNPFYFSVAYHPEHAKMGVVVKYSATSWRVYCAWGKTNVKRFLHSVKSNLYNCRLSRIDFAVDYQNWDFSVNDIYQNIKSQHLKIQNYKGIKNPSEVTGHEADGVASTFYVGSRKSGTKLFLRVYDKQQEQIEKGGIRLQEALSTQSWVRFEAVYKGKYAHILTDLIRNTDEDNLTDLIADKITEKYRFYDMETGEYTDFTKALLEKSKVDFERLQIDSPRDNDLIGSLYHLISGSGLFSTLYKCDEIWGNEASKELLKYLHGIFKKEYEPNEDIKLWLKKHKNTMEKQSLNDVLKLLEQFKSQKSDKEPI